MTIGSRFLVRVIYRLFHFSVLGVVSGEDREAQISLMVARRSMMFTPAQTESG